MSEKKKAIKNQTYLQALGLFTLAHQRANKMREFEAAIGDLLGYEDSYLNSISDEIQDGGDFDTALANEGFVVAPK